MTCAVGCKWVRWLGAFWSWGRELCLNRQQKPLFSVKDTSLWFSCSLDTGQAQHTQTNAHIRYPSVVFQDWVVGGWGGWLYYSCCNTDLIQGRSDPSSFFSTSAPLDHVLILHSPHEWETQRGAALTPATCITCHSGPYAVMQLMMGIAASYKS